MTEWQIHEEVISIAGVMENRQPSQTNATPEETSEHEAIERYLNSMDETEREAMLEEARAASEQLREERYRLLDETSERVYQMLRRRAATHEEKRRS